MSEKNLVIGVDLGGSHVYAGVVNMKGEVLVKKETDIDLSHNADTIIKESIIPVIKAAIEDNPFLKENIKAIGMGIPGNLDSARGICFFSPNFKWRDVYVTPPIQEALGLPVFMLNDVRSAALGEKHFGAGKGINNFVCCAIGTGIGGGIVCNGNLILGEKEAAGEIGHITVDPNGHLCGCGNYGCIEAIASGPNIARRGREAMEADKESILWKMVNDISEVDAFVLFKAAKEGDKTALKVWEETGRYLGICFAGIIHTVNPQRFIMGGRVANAMEFFLPALKEEIKKRARMVPPDSVEIVHAGLLENAGMIGAAALAYEKIGVL
ncbi:MAG: ROK family protein [Firmicutes bacterium]|nr:ROK family protein [Bacillota bacterium]